MMEKTPSSVSRGRRRGEMMWTPEKARACKGEGPSDWVGWVGLKASPLPTGSGQIPGRATVATRGAIRAD
jgi:hypothetical protein